MCRRQLGERTGNDDTVAWVHLEDGRILCARPRGKDVFYVPGGKREGGESDLQTLLREIAEELTVALRPETVRHAGTYQADHPDGTVVLMSCYTAEYSGALAASSEIDELAWFGYADRRYPPPVGVTEPGQLVDLAAGDQRTGVLRGVAAHQHHGAIRMIRLVGARVPGLRPQRDGQLLGDLSQQGLQVALTALAFPARNVEDVLPARPGA